MKSHANEAVVHEVEPLSEVEFQSDRTSPELVADRREQSILGLFAIVWPKRQLVYKATLWALALSTIMVFLVPKRYESTVSIMPPEPASPVGTMISALLGGKSSSSSGSTGSSGLAAMAGNLFGVKSSGAIFVDVLRSRTVQYHIVDQFHLQRVYWEYYKEEARKKLDNKTDITEDRKSGVIHISITDRNPTRARDIGRAYVEELDHLVAQVSTSSARRQRIFIETRLASVKQDLEDAEQKFSVFASKNTALDVKEQTKAMVESAAVLQGQLIATESELQSVEQIYTGNNVRVRALKARVDELRRQLDKLGGTDASLAPGANQPNELYPSIRKLPLLGVEWADLYRRVKVQETVFELLTQQYELARIEEAKEIPTVNVIDAPDLPEEKSFPPRLLIISLLTLFSAACAIAWVIGSVRIRSLEPQDPRKVLGLRLIATVNRTRDYVAHHRMVRRLEAYLHRSQDQP
jgi:capsule polysaccharide export protein KpsE/RkpR